MLFHLQGAFSSRQFNMGFARSMYSIKNSKHRNRSQTGKGVRVGRWHPPNLPTSDSCAWQQQPIKGGTTPCILRQELGIGCILSTHKSPNRFSTMLLAATPFKKNTSRVLVRVSHGVSIEYLFHSNQHLWYLISHSTPFLLERAIALPWPTSSIMSRACSFGPHQTTSKSAESKEFKDPSKVESLLTDPWPNVFFSGVSPPSKMFSQFLWGSPDQNGTFSPSINTYYIYIYRIDHLIPKIGTYLDHMDCQVKWMFYPWSSQHTIGLQDQTTSPRPQFHRRKNHRFSIWLFNRDPYHS